mmetsp:Transcript_99628/g.171578  ORF Transcript_99628/g.171578 Transcript_99628/m.171578 type:complete len:225 (+) Transcript_99628:1259-1933(+)
MAMAPAMVRVAPSDPLNSRTAPNAIGASTLQLKSMRRITTLRLASTSSSPSASTTTQSCSMQRVWAWFSASATIPSPLMHMNTQARGQFHMWVWVVSVSPTLIPSRWTSRTSTSMRREEAITHRFSPTSAWLNTLKRPLLSTHRPTMGIITMQPVYRMMPFRAEGKRVSTNTSMNSIGMANCHIRSLQALRKWLRYKTLTRRGRCSAAAALCNSGSFSPLEDTP